MNTCPSRIALCCQKGTLLAHCISHCGVWDDYLTRRLDSFTRTIHCWRVIRPPPVSLIFVMPLVALAMDCRWLRVLQSAQDQAAARACFCLTSEGEWQEGSTWEALAFAVHHQLDNLTVLVNHNGLQGFGRTASVASMSPLNEKIAGFNVDIQRVDGHKLDQIRVMLDKPADRCGVLILDIIKGHDVSFMEDRMEWHYLPLKQEQYAQALLDLESQ